MANVADVAKYILALGKVADDEGGDLITNLKLQKLVYYCQGFTLAITGEPLFPEPIEAWTHGPVCPPLYSAYKRYGKKAIPIDNLNLSVEPFTDQHMKIMGEVFEVYGQFSAWRLREMTHQEPPWVDTPQGEIITHDKLREFFLTQVTDD